MSDPNTFIPLRSPANLEAEAAAWIARLDRGTQSEADLAAFRAWRALSPLHRQAADQMMALWSDLDELSHLPHILEAKIATRDRRTLGQLPRGWVAGLAAASVIVAGVAAITGLQLLPRTEVYDTAVGGQRTINLDDGSSIQLNTNSKVEVRYSPRARDLRLLKGEAYFEVAPNKQRPFSVYAHQDVVSAVGTAFVVRLTGDQVEVTVTKGKVEVAAMSHPPPSAPLDRIAALPRKTLTMVSASQGSTELAVVEKARLVEHLDLAPPEVSRKLAWRQGMLVFNGDDLASVVADVSRYTDVQIEIADPALKSLKIGGYFKVGEVDPMLEALDSSFGVHVERLDRKHVRLTAAL